MRKFICFALSLICLFSVIPISSSAADGTVTVSVDDEYWMMEDENGIETINITCIASPTLCVESNETEFSITSVRMYFRIVSGEYRPKYFDDAAVDFYVDMEYHPTEHYTTQIATYEKTSRGWGDISYLEITARSDRRKGDIVAISYPSPFHSTVDFTCNFDYYGKDANGESIDVPDWFGLWFTLAEVKRLAGY